MGVLETAIAYFDLVRPYAGAVFCVLGALLAVIGTIGVLRFPDFYTRLHASSVTDTSSATFLVVGMALMAPDWVVVAKLAAIWVFLFLTTPTASHAIANAAYVAGLQPVIGRSGATPEPLEDEEGPI